MKRVRPTVPILLLALLAAALASLSCSSSSSGPSEAPDPLSCSIDSPAATVVINVGGTVNFQATVNGGTGPYTYAWDFDGGAAASAVEDPGDVVFPTVGVYAVTFTVTDNDGDDDGGTVTVVVTDADAYYPFNGDAEDEIGDNDATVNGATLAPDRFGNEDSAYSFDGSSYIQTPIDSNTLPISFSVWFNASSVSGDRSVVDSDWWAQSGHSLIIGWWNHDGDIHIEYHNSSIDSDVPVTINTWYHAVVCFSDSIWLYVDGARVGAWEYPAATLDGDYFRFGRHNAGDPQWYAGVIDDVRFYHRVLTAEEAQALYSEGGWPVR
jgi:hypothetical protein